MKKRQWAIVGGVAIIVLALFTYRFLANTPAEQKPANKTPVKGVTVMIVKNHTVPVEVKLNGKLHARNKISIFAEVSGVLQSGRKKFEEGVRFRKGEIMLQLENSEATSAYLSARSQYVNTLTQALPDIKLDYPSYFEEWRAYLEQISQGNRVPEPPRVNDDKLRLFLTGRQVYSSYQNLQSSMVRLSKYNISAPFDGVVTESKVDPGILVSPGQQIGEFIEPGDYELEATVSASELALIQVGDSVELSSPDNDRRYSGVVFRSNAKVDPQTQRVKVFVKVKDENLRDGLFMTGRVAGRQVTDAFRLDRKLLYDETFTYTVADSSLLKQALQIVQKSPGSVIVRGLSEGALIPSQPISGAYTGMPVQVIDTLTQKQN